MQIHAVISLVICACLSMALGRSIGYDDYSDELFNQNYGSWYDSQTEGFDMSLKDVYDVDSAYNTLTDTDGSGDDDSKVGQATKSLFKISFVTYNQPLRNVDDDADKDSDEDNKEDQNDDSNESTEEAVTEHSNEATDDDDNDDDKQFMKMCTLENGFMACSYNIKLGAYDTVSTVNEIDHDDISAHTELASEDDSDEDTEPPQDNASEVLQPSDYHGNLLRKLTSSTSNKNLLTNEYQQNLNDFQLANVNTQRDLWSLLDQNMQLLNDFSDISNDRSVYNGEQHRKLMKDINHMLNNVDKMRSDVMMMQKLEQRQDYHRLLQQLVREIYGDNKLDTIDDI